MQDPLQTGAHIRRECAFLLGEQFKAGRVSVSQGGFIRRLPWVRLPSLRSRHEECSFLLRKLLNDLAHERAWSFPLP